MRLGFIGLGVMGRPMALNLMKGGHEMAVYARRAASVEPLVSAGARALPTPAEVAAHAEVIFTVVTNSSDVEDVVLGSSGLIHGAASGSVVVDMETISPVVARNVACSLAEKNIDMLDAPVSGGPMGAEQATLSIMVGGKPAVFERVRPLLECLGKTIVHVGDHGAGQITKACNQLALLVTAQGIAEALSLAKKAGVDVARVRDVMMGGVAASRVLELFGKRMIERNFDNGIDARLYYKDLDIVLGLAHALGIALPAAALTMQSINALIGRGEGRKDLSSLIRIVEDMSGGKP
ncbi:MAG: NAD(P)-dependent oxidoreductase [Betaproteobacteria bacterium]